MVLNPEYFKTYDLVLAIVMIVILFRSYQKGLILQLWGIASTIGSLLGAYFLYASMTKTYPLFDVPLIGTADTMVSGFLWFVLLFIGLKWIFFIFQRIFQASIGKAPKPLSVVNHLAGLGIGLIEVIIILNLWISFCGLPLVKNGDSYIESSQWTQIRNQVKQEVKNG